MASSSEDPLGLSEIDPAAIEARISARDTKGKGKEPNDLDRAKEARLAQKESRLASGGRKPSVDFREPPPEPAPKPPDRSVLIDKIMAYRERFPHVKKRNTISAKSSTEELFDELHYIELQLGSGNTGFNLGATVLFAGMTGIERLTRDHWNPLGLNLTGLGTVTQQNMAEFQPIIDELMIKHNAGAYTAPEWRLVLAMGATVLTVHAANSNPEMAQAVKSMNQAVRAPPGSEKL